MDGWVLLTVRGEESFWKGGCLLACLLACMFIYFSIHIPLKKKKSTKKPSYFDKTFIPNHSFFPHQPNPETHPIMLIPIKRPAPTPKPLRLTTYPPSLSPSFPAPNPQITPQKPYFAGAQLDLLEWTVVGDGGGVEG